jgi:hypothetical protein
MAGRRSTSANISHLSLEGANMINEGGDNTGGNVHGDNTGGN